MCGFERRWAIIGAMLIGALSQAGAAGPQRLAELWGGDRWGAKAGVDWRFVYTGEMSAKLTGGGVRSGADLRADASLYLGVDTAAAGLWRGGSVQLHFQSQHGATVSDRLGDFHCCSNITGGDFVQLAQCYYRHDFAGGHWLKIGKQEANDDFAGSEYTSTCLNSSAAYLPLMPLPSSPNQAWGISAGLQVAPHLSLNLGGFRDKYGHQPIYFAQPNLDYTISGCPGWLRPGWWWDTNNYNSVDQTTPTFYGGSYGYYLNWSQQVSRHSTKAQQCGMLGLFGHLAWAPRNRSTAHTGWSLGAQWDGFVPGRPADSLAVAVYQLGFDRRAGLPFATETAIEGLYSTPIAPWLMARVGLQWIVHPGGAGADAGVVETRFEATF